MLAMKLASIPGRKLVTSLGLTLVAMAGLAACTEENTTVLTAGISPIASTVTVDMTSGVVANGTNVVTVTIVVRDAFYRPVAGQTVQLAVTGSYNTVTQPAAVTDAFGVAVGTVASITAESKTITATVDPAASPLQITTAPAVGFIGDAANISAALSTVSAGPAVNVVANGTTISTIAVTVLDINGNAIPGQTVQLAASGSSNTLTQPGAMTDAA